MKKILLLATAIVSFSAQAQVSGPVVEKLRNGEACFVNFTTFYKNGAEAECNGTIARSVAYNLRFNKANATWTATGAVCNKGTNKTHTDVGPHPSDGYLVVWGAKFKFDGASKVFDLDGKEIGKVGCS